MFRDRHIIGLRGCTPRHTAPPPGCQWPDGGRQVLLIQRLTWQRQDDLQALPARLKDIFQATRRLRFFFCCFLVLGWSTLLIFRVFMEVTCEKDGSDTCSFILGKLCRLELWTRSSHVVSIRRSPLNRAAAGNTAVAAAASR